MTIIAKCAVELNGHIYHKGDSCTYEGDISRRIAANFTNKDGLELKTLDAPTCSIADKMDEPEDKENRIKVAIARMKEIMGREGIKRALDSMKVAYSDYTNTDYLAKTLLIARGEANE